jgi:antimicrobial peptide system SdpA family protein
MSPMPTLPSHAPEVEELRRDRAMGVLLSMIVLAATVLGVYAIHEATPTNPIALPGEDRASMVKIFPQGWKFFTRDPRTADPVPLRRVGEAWLPYDTLVTQSATNFFGASRQGRAIGPELTWVLASAKDADWQACRESPSACLDRMPVKTIKTSLPHPQLCGSVGIVSQAPVPWAWASTGRPVVMPSSVLRLEIRC